MGMVLIVFIVLYVGELSFDIVDDEMEIGIGIYGEFGCVWFLVEFVDVIVD